MPALVTVRSGDSAPAAVERPASGELLALAGAAAGVVDVARPNSSRTRSLAS